jgi:hypothetical protein
MQYVRYLHLVGSNGLKKKGMVFSNGFTSGKLGFNKRPNLYMFNTISSYPPALYRLYRFESNRF